MKTYTKAQMDEILKNHKHWLQEDCDGWENMRANLTGANLTGADLTGAKNVPYIPMACPDTGSFIGWKKAHGKIVKLLIPIDAMRSSATWRKCRCNKAMVLAIENQDGTPSGLSSVASDFDAAFLYTAGETVYTPNFCADRFRECAPGIHFFVNRQEAVEYNG